MTEPTSDIDVVRGVAADLLDYVVGLGESADAALCAMVDRLARLAWPLQYPPVAKQEPQELAGFLAARPELRNSCHRLLISVKPEIPIEDADAMVMALVAAVRAETGAQEAPPGALGELRATGQDPHRAAVE